MSRFQDLLQQASSIYFVCSGNIIRSSFAELYAKHKGLTNVASYGTTYHNNEIHRRSKQELIRLGVDKTIIEKFIPTHIDSLGSFQSKAVHIVMTREHRSQLLNYGIEDKQIIMIKSLLNQQGDVADPYFSNNYEDAYQTIKEAVNQIASILS